MTTSRPTAADASANQTQEPDGFIVHTPEGAPEGSRETLAKAQEKYGFVPNLMGILAEAPAAVKSYAAVYAFFTESSFTPGEQQVVLLSASHGNGCDYCVAVHSTMAKMTGVPEEVVSALRAGRPLPDTKLQALSAFTKLVVTTRARLSESQVRDFIAAGYSKAQVLEVITGVALKTISNYTNHLADTPLDDMFQPQRWTPPQDIAAAA